LSGIWEIFGFPHLLFLPRVFVYNHIMAAQETLLNGRYRLITQQGSGGMAVIYKAQDIALGRIVAVKVLRPSLTGDPTFLTRFRQEARNVANLAHPNIVTLFDFGQDGNTYYMVMEYVDGKDLKKLIRESAPFTVERALHIGIQICAGVGYAHRAELVHADVKPQNVLVTGDDHVKVTDFGIAQAIAATQNQEKQSVVWGSPHYFAPEQASGEAPTPASDVYSIGIVLFEMLTGKLPYNGADQQELALAHIRDQIPHVMEFNPNVPVHLDRIIYKVMSKEPANRYRTADQLGRILISYQKQGQDVTANVPPVMNPNQPANPATITQTKLPKAQPTPQPGTPPPSQPAQRLQAPYIPPQTTQPSSTPAYVQSAREKTPPPSAPIVIGQGPIPSRTTIQTGTGPIVPNNNSSNAFNNGYTPVDASGPRRTMVPEYQAPAPPSPIDAASIVLAIIAFIAVMGLFPLWLLVLRTWTMGQ
jgi:serine/threonine-protein kinase